MYSGFFLGLLAIVAIIPLHETADILPGVTCKSDDDCKSVAKLLPTCCKALQAGSADTGTCVTAGTCCGTLTPNSGDAQKKCTPEDTCCGALGICLPKSVECGGLCDYTASPADNKCLSATPDCCQVTTSGVNTGVCVTKATCPTSL